MIIVLKTNTPNKEIEQISEALRNWNVTPETIASHHEPLIGLVGETAEIDPQQIEQLSPFIEKIIRINKPFKRVSREFYNGKSSKVFVETPSGLIPFSQEDAIVSIAGPCSVETEEMIIHTALQVKEAGAQFLRGGAYKPRTSPYSFQGHGETALDWLAKARKIASIGIVTEVMDTADLEQVAEVADIVQIGSRNMQNFSLLKKLGTISKPILLKRGLSATIEDWLMAAEYVLASGNPNVILCERGIRTFDSQYTRNTLDLAAIPVLRQLTHLPVMIDPSHGTGSAQYVTPMAKAAIIAGADSLMIEVHPNPAQALSDGPQSLTIEQYKQLMTEIPAIAQTVGRWKHKYSLSRHPCCLLHDLAA